jgi:hypothetical protein
MIRVEAAQENIARVYKRVFGLSLCNIDFREYAPILNPQKFTRAQAVDGSFSTSRWRDGWPR